MVLKNSVQPKFLENAFLAFFLMIYIPKWGMNLNGEKNP